MEPDTVAPETTDADTEDGADVMASVETGTTDTFILADVSRDDAFLTVPLADAASLPAWR